jgi:hypothetical protein
MTARILLLCALPALCMLFASGVSGQAAPPQNPSARQQALAAEPYVTIWRETPNDFYRQNFPAAVFNAIVESSPTEVWSVASGETVSAQLRSRFNISGSWTPAVYGAALEKVRELNPGIDFEKLTPGTMVKLPRLPSTGKSEPGPNPANRVPNLLLPGARSQYRWSDEVEAFTGTPGPVAAVARAAQSELQFFRMRASEAAAFINALKRAGGDRIRFGQSGRMVVALGGRAGQPSQIQSVLSTSHATKIRERLTGDGPRPLVVILDDSMPDHTSFANSKRFVLDASAAIRKAYQLGPSPNTDAITNLADVVSTSADLLYPNLRTHAAMIHAALDEFSRLDENNTISIVYLPLAATQVQAGPLIREILYLAQLLKFTNPQLPPAVTASAEQRKDAQAVAQQTIDDNDALQAAVLQPVSGNQVFVSTDSMYLEALSIFLKYFSAATGRPHVMSFSWTAPNLQLTTYFDVGAYGWRVTAAGNGIPNGQAVDILRPPTLQFAYRGFEPKDFLVVANSTASASICPTNTFDQADVVVLGLAFPGNVTSTICGTSFSTPRVAWLLAAREVIAGKKIAPGDTTSINAWIDAKRSLIVNLHHSPAPFVERYSFDIDRLLGSSGGH